jgi:hypothetical protein
MQLMDHHIQDMLNAKLINGDEAGRCRDEKNLPKKTL